MDSIFQNIQSFLFLIKLGFHEIYLRKGDQLFEGIGFHLSKNSELSSKKKPSFFVCD